MGGVERARRKAASSFWSACLGGSSSVIENDINTNGQIGHEADFNPADINPVIPDSVKIKLADLILAWARYDALMSHLLFQMMNVPYDIGDILFKRMGITDKQSKIVDMAAHFGDPEIKSLQSKIKKLIDVWYPLRNVVCHSQCIGMSNSDFPGCLAFLKSDIIKGQPGKRRITYYPMDTIETATGFANFSAEAIPPMILMIATIHAESQKKAGE